MIFAASTNPDGQPPSLAIVVRAILITGALLSLFSGTPVG